MKTSFKNLSYLKKTLDKLNIIYKKVETGTRFTNENVVIPQSNGYNIEFVWNAKEYELVLDMSFWKQDYPIESFIDKLAEKYANEVIIGESQKIGFQPIKYQQHNDGSNTIILERWNTKNN